MHHDKSVCNPAAMICFPKLLRAAGILSCFYVLSSGAPLRRVSNTNIYIVKLKTGVDPKKHLSSSSFAAHHDRLFSGRALNGYTIELTEPAAILMQAEYSQEIEYVEKDQAVRLASESVQTHATWGLQRISQQTTLPSGSNATALNYTYHFDSSAGEGIDIYVFDTGVYAEHEEFTGRVTHSPVFAADSTTGDRAGHGTHCAGSAAGTRYGVAKKAQIIDVKVLPDNEAGRLSDILSGLNWAITNMQRTNRTGVISMSLGTSESSSLDDAVRSTIASGLTVVVAAGNQASSASNWSPAKVEEAITVGNVDITGRMWPYSNYGPAVDIFAPGTDIVSAGLGSPNAIQVDSGTSMAAPHVAGIVAYLLALEGPRTPAELSARLKELAVPGVFSGLQPNTTRLVAQLQV